MEAILFKNITILIIILTSLQQYQQFYFVKQNIGCVVGIIEDMNEARISGVQIIFQGARNKWITTTSEDGSYKIELPIGTYQVSTQRLGFCPMRRASFKVRSSKTITVNFILVVCSLGNKIIIDKRKYKNEIDEYKYPFHEKMFNTPFNFKQKTKLLIQYCRQIKSNKNFIYHGFKIDTIDYAVILSYDLLLVRAQKILINPLSFQIKAQGNVLLDDGRQRIQARNIEIVFQNGTPIVKVQPQ